MIQLLYFYICILVIKLYEQKLAHAGITNHSCVARPIYVPGTYRLQIINTRSDDNVTASQFKL